ncbi:family 43 glycosylhydrolase [Paenibacillus alba]|uniref:family 43 glycosylhydrolase n=1 Tax=Paenibacillus alba TaxID=1197127 RepID=UPI00156565F6|nr:family 43 glycosylhydrolase [Paenibacillus alba]NQX66529.1 family 43 glycosylhydrolase [Paenibacillus alba]
MKGIFAFRQKRIRQVWAYMLLMCMAVSYFPVASVSVEAAAGEPLPVFREDFNDGNADGWTTYGSSDAGNRGTWAVNAAKQYRTTGAPGSKAIFQNTSFADLIYEADLQVAGINDDHSGLLFRVTAPAPNVADGYNGYFAALRVDKTITLSRVTGAGGNEYKELQRVSYPYASGHMKVVAVGNHIQVYVEDMTVPKIDFTDNDGKQITSPGAVGLRTWWGTTNFDNLEARAYSPSVTAAPVFSTPDGVYNSEQYIALASATDGASIRYTLDGTTPNASSPVYTSPIVLSSDTTIKAYADKAGEMVSSVATSSYIIAQSEQVFTDDFNDGNAEGWKNYTGLTVGAPTVWSVTYAVYQYVAANPRGAKSVIDAVYQNFVFEVDVNPQDAVANNSGVIFRVTDPADGVDKVNAYYAGINAAGKLQVGKMSTAGAAGTWTEIASIVVSGVNPNSLNHLKVIVIGTHYVIYVNDKLAFDFTDTTYTTGTVGLRAWNDDKTVAFDNVSLKRLTPIVLPAVEPVSHQFSDDFNDDNANGWTTYQGIWNVTDKAYQVTNKGAGFKSVADGTSFSNFEYEADITMKDGVNSDNAGLIFRVSNPSNGGDNLKGYYAGITSNGRVQLGKFNNNWKELASILYPIQQNKAYHMKVTAVGSHIDIYIDGEHIVSAVDTSYSTGAIGVRAHFVATSYDNIFVKDLGAVPPPTYDWSWVKGAVFVPTNVVNQIQQWDEYDHAINDRELGYAQMYGINLVRVFVHNLLWKDNSAKLLANLEDFLTLADKYGIKVELALFDDCWDDYPVMGPQLAPRYGAHNSRWVEGPGDAIKSDYAANKQDLKAYVQGIVRAHKDDSRIAFWNIYNEPSNGESGLMDQMTKQIMNDARIWVKEIDTTHPVSSTGGQFSGESTSDFITWHPYEADYPTPYGISKEILADETMNRLTQSVPGIVEHYGKQGIGFVMWEFGIGRDNTRFPWGSDTNPLTSEPAVPFHGITYPDGHPWDVNDVKALTGAAFDTLPVFNVHYFKDENFTSLVKSSITPKVDFDLGDEKGTGSPDPTVGIGEDHFSTRWVGTIQPVNTGTHTIYVDSDNIARVWIGDSLVVDKTSSTREEKSAAIVLTAGQQYAVKIEYVHAAGDASLHVKWSHANLAKQALTPVYAGKSVQSVSLDAAALSVKVNETKKLTATITPADASSQLLTWSSSHTGTATVDRNGYVKGVNKGTAVITVTAAGGVTAKATVTVKDSGTFMNPIVPVSSGAGSADPSVVFKDGYYYYVKSENDGLIQVAKARRLQDIGTAPRITVYTPPAGQMYSKELWAPEIQYLNGKWYIYLAADDGNNNNHRMYVIEGNSQDAQGTYTMKGKIADATDKWAIDGTVFTKSDNSMYFVWSGWDGDANVRQNIYIAPMSNPWTISGPRVLLSTPDQAWELHGTPNINEGPEILSKDGKIFIVYSASGSWTDDYTLGMLTNTDGNVLSPASWTKSGPVLSKAASAFGPGHNSFTKSPDGTEDWIVYHADLKSGGGWGNRTVRAQKFTWNADGTPNFGTPVAYGASVQEASGTPSISMYSYEAEDAELGGTAKINNSDDASGGKVVGHIDTAGTDYIVFHVNVEEAGTYAMTLMAANGTGGTAIAQHDVSVNNGASQVIDYKQFGWGRYNPSSITIALNSGLNTIKLTKKTNFAELDRLILELLVPSNPNGHQAALLAAIASAQTKHDEAVEEERHGFYLAGAKAALQAAIDQAAIVAGNNAVTEEQWAAATQWLAEAITAFEAKKINANLHAGGSSVSVGDLAIVAASYGKKQGDVGWDAQAIKADLNKDNQVDISDLVIVAKAIME